MTPILTCPPEGHQLSDHAQVLIIAITMAAIVALGGMILVGCWLAWWRK